MFSPANVFRYTVIITVSNNRIMSHAPQAICGPAYDLVQRISPLVRELDFGLDWMELEAGRALYRYCISSVCGMASFLECYLRTTFSMS